MPKDGQLTHFHGVIKDAETGKGIPNAVFDMWQASTNGKYDVFDPENRTSQFNRLPSKTPFPPPPSCPAAPTKRTKKP